MIDGPKFLTASKTNLNYNTSAEVSEINISFYLILVNMLPRTYIKEFVNILSKLLSILTVTTLI